MTDRAFYQAIEGLSYDRENELITVRCGDKAGRKLLYSDKKLTAASEGADPSGILSMGEEYLLREKLGHKKTLVVCGAGYVGQGVIRLGKFLGFCVICLDDRIDFGKAARDAGADEVLIDEFRESLASGKVPFDEDTYFVVVTRGHRYDKECLLEIMRRDFGYVGMMGSRARSARMVQTLAEQGIDEGKVKQLHAPVGLKIGASTPEEIAVSIISEIIQVKQSHPGKDVFPEEILQAIDDSEEGKCVLAVITQTRGSTPRKPGSRMLVRRDRSLVGTIGGGCMEAAVIREAMMLMADQDYDDGRMAPKNSEIFKVDLAGRGGNEADMLCGGTMEVLMEVV